jgi:MFS family permease
MLNNRYKDTFAALQYPNYRLWFIGQLVSLVGTWMQSTAQGFLIFDLTHSAAFLGYVSFAAGVPTWLLTLYGGLVADRVPRRKLLILTQSTMMVLAAVLAFLSFTHRVQPWHIIVLAAFLGIANAFDAPARQSFVAEMVDRKDLTNAIALNATMFNLGVVVGPAVAGLVYAWLGPSWCFTINAISFIAVITSLSLMKVPAMTVTRKNSPMVELKEGFHAAFSDPTMRLLFAGLFFLGVFGFGLLVLIPAWSVNVLHGDVTTNGLLLSARGAGSLAGGLMIAAIGSRRNRGKIWTIGSFILPFSLVFFGISHLLPISLFAIMVMGWSLISVVNITNGLIQSNTSDLMRGRVMSYYSLIFMGGQTVGGLLNGLVASKFNEPVAVFISAVILGLFAMIVFALKPSFRKID